MFNEGLRSSKTHEWETPQWFFDRLDDEFHFTLDAAASAENAKCKRYYTIQDNALWQPWDGVVWCNPPYGRIVGKFVRKGFTAAQGGAVVVMLIAARTDTKYWHNYVMRSREIRFVKGRLYFGGKGRAPFPSAVIVFREGEHQPRISSIDGG